MEKKIFSLALLLKGFTAVIAQTLLVRELLIVFYGNELTLSLILCVWLVSGAAGSAGLSRLFKNAARPQNPYAGLLLASNIGLIAALVIIRTSKTLLGVPAGEVLTLLQTAFIIFLSLVIFALCDGAMFATGFRLLESFTRLYILESLGIVAGGIVFTFLLLNFLNSFQIVFLILSLNMLCLGALLLKGKSRAVKITAWLPFCAALFLFTQADTWQKDTLEQQWPRKNLLLYENSFYGNIAVTQEDSQYTLFYDGLPTLSIPAPDAFFTEDFVHLPLSVRPNAKKVLFIGHAAGGLLTQALKYPLETIVSAETDPLLVDCLRVLPDASLQKELNAARVSLRLTDGRRYLKTTRERFDCIFVNTDLPTSLSLNRYATKEFFGEIKKTLSPGGIAVFKTWGSLSALSRELKKMNASLYKTLFSKFPYIEVIPGDGYNLFVASEQPLEFQTYKMYWNLTELKIETYLINPSYLEIRLDKAHADWFYAQIKDELKTADINQDLKPSGLTDALSLYYAQFSRRIPAIFAGFKKIRPMPSAAVLAALLIAWALLVRVSPRPRLALNFTAFSTGFFAMSLQILILFLFQSFLGYLFRWLALLTTGFMSGAALGALYAEKNRRRWNTLRRLGSIEIVLAGLNIGLILTGIALFKDTSCPTNFFSWFFCLMSLAAGFFAGLEIPLIYETAVKTDAAKAAPLAGRIYALDLAGACAGVLLTPLLLIPGCGIIPTLGLLGLLKIGNGLAILGLEKS